MNKPIYFYNDYKIFDHLSLGNPQRLSGGAFFSKLILNDDETLIFQTPKCCSKNGIISTSKKIYCDLLFQENNGEFIKWIDHLETTIKYLIFDKKDLWFHNEMEFEDIEYFFNPSIRVYKRNKYLLRSHVKQPKHIKKNYTLQIYDENENDLEISDIKVEQKIISILEILGIKYSNTSFHIEYCLRQIMLLDEKPIFNKCLIQANKYNTIFRKKNIVNATSDDDTTIVTTNDDDTQNVTTNDDDTQNNVDPENNADTENNADHENNADTENNTDTENNADTKNNANAENNDGIMTIMTNTVKKTDEINDNVTINGVIKNVVKKKEDTNVNITENVVEENLSKEINDVSNNLETLEKVLPKFRNSLQHLEENVEEIDLNKMDIADESIKIKERKEVYYELYKQAKKKAIDAKQKALQCFLELKKIKNTYLITEIDESEDIFDNIQKIKI